MENKVKIALLQHTCDSNQSNNLKKVERLVRLAAIQGSQIVCTQELFADRYFPQTIQADHYQLAEPMDGPINKMFQKLSAELNIVTICSFYEYASAGTYFNTATVYDAGGECLGKYRKHHIPEAPKFLEKYYFTPGDGGYPVYNTKYGTIGVLICWDEWFPEASRIMAMKGAEIIFYPTAIGINKNLPEIQTAKPWRKAIISNGIHNNIYVAAPNRVGEEEAIDGTGSMQFYGTSFIADPWGEIIKEASTAGDEVVIAEVDLSEVRRTRDILQFYRDRRPDTYNELLEISIK